MKPIWVDECYTFYGVDHSSFASFFDSILSGINFSPPLYFLVNWFANIWFTISIEILRLESIFWTVIGLVLFYQTTRKTFGIGPTVISIMLVVSQSNLLLDNSIEARHYTMFFASASWVFFTLSTFKCSSKHIPRKVHFLLFSSHLCLCLTHYVGIVFSILVGVGFLFCKNDKQLIKRVPWSMLSCWALVLPVYLFLLQNQSSHLSAWHRDDSLIALFKNYDYVGSVISLILVPLTFLLFPLNKNSSLFSTSSNDRLIVMISILWFLTPVFFWLLANLSPLNLLKDRYFIPKEVGLLTILAFFCLRIGSLFRTTKKNELVMWSVPLLVVSVFSTFTIFLYHKRSSFGYSENRNYHHWLSVDERIEKLNSPIVLSGDPLFFPNAYRNNDQYFFRIDDENLINVYSKFSSKIQLVNPSQILAWDSFILIGDKNSFENLNLSSFLATEIGKVHEKLPLLIKKFERI